MPELKIEVPTVVFVLFMLVFEDITYTLTLVFCVLTHEAGHMIASRALGVKIKALRINIFGARIELSALSSYISEFLIAAAGPAANIVFGGLGMIYIKDPVEGWPFFSLVNFALAFVNLLPISTLDGGRMIFCLTSHFFGVRKSEKITRALSAAAIVTLWIISVFLWFELEKNISLLILCSYLFYSLILKRGF